MESELFLLFAVALALYFGWALTRDEPESEMDLMVAEEVHGTQKTRTSPAMRAPHTARRMRVEDSAKTVKSKHTKNVNYDADYAELQLVIDNGTLDAVFNPANLPLTTAGRGEKRDVYPHATKLVYKLGRKAAVGLSLLDVCRIQREATETQTRYTYEMVVQRDTPVPSKRMAVLRVQMIMDFSQPNGPSGEGFFNDYMLTNEPTPKLESITLVDIVRDYVDMQSEATTQYYALNNEADDFAKQQQISKIVRDTRKKHNSEIRDLNVLVDENGEDAQDYQTRFPEYSTVVGRGAGMGTQTVAEKLRDC
jgi:hypothetical protein